MTIDRHERVKSLFLEACEVEPAARTALIEERCAAMADGNVVRTEVMSLLDHDEGESETTAHTATGASQHPFGDVVAKAAQDVLSDVDPDAARAARPQDEPLPDEIGRYRVLGVLGRGGMGVVYRAEQDHPRRTVALKVIRSGLITPRMLRRFEHETEALGRLQHPGIAQIFEAGTASIDGADAPYFALELVEGRTLSEHCERHSLGTRKRLDLVARVADAVHHAHIKGVVHRDLKPGNILVDATGQPKILDFGIARIADVDTAATLGATLATDVGQIVGTLPYMSPEQVAGDSEHLDARSDVYALGVIAYELLAGQLPYDVARCSMLDVARVIREEEPRPLSSIQRVFRGDVETLVAKSLEKERDRRYDAASEFAADIRRYLADEPILARPASAAYQLRKFARRNRPLVAGVAAAFLALAAGTIVATKMYVDEAQARRFADDRRLEAAEVQSFFVDMLRSADPSHSGRDARVVDMLDASSESIDERFPERPFVRAVLHRTLGVTYTNLGQTAAARPHLESAISLYEEAARRDGVDIARDVLDARRNLGLLFATEGHWSEAREILNEVASQLDDSVGANTEDALLTRVLLAQAQVHEGDYEGVEEALRDLGDRARELFGESSDVALEADDGLGALLDARQQFDDAIEMHTRLLETRRERDGSTATETLESMHNLGAALVGMNRFDEAAPHVIQCLEGRRARFGLDHPATLRTQALHGLIQFGLGKLDVAEVALRGVVDAHRERPEQLSPVDGADALNNLANVLLVAQRPTEAEPLFAEAVPLLERHRGPSHIATLTAMIGLAQTRVYAGEVDAADALIAHIEEHTSNAPGSRALRVRRLALSLGAMVASRRGDDEAAVRTYALLAEALRGDSTARLDRLVALTNLGSAQRKAGRPLEGLAPLQEAVDGLVAALSARHPNTLAAKRQLALTTFAAGHFADAVTLGRSLLEAQLALHGNDSKSTAVAQLELARSLLALEDDDVVEEARNLARRADVVLTASAPDSRDAERAAEVLADAEARAAG